MSCVYCARPTIRCRRTHSDHKVNFRLDPILALQADQQVFFQRPRFCAENSLRGVPFEVVFADVLHGCSFLQSQLGTLASNRGMGS